MQNSKLPPWRNPTFGFTYYPSETHDLDGGLFRLRMHAYGLPTIERKALSDDPMRLNEPGFMEYPREKITAAEAMDGWRKWGQNYITVRPLDTTTDGPF